VDALDYDPATGDAAKRRPFLDLSAGPGVPDGLCVDADGCLWIAMWGGSVVRRFAPDGREIEAVAMPVSQPSSCCFAGDVLVVTSAAHGLSEAQLLDEAHAGAVFALRPGVSGPGAVQWPGYPPS
jgi:sugar lactone lactonase YvrE